VAVSTGSTPSSAKPSNPPAGSNAAQAGTSQVAQPMVGITRSGRQLPLRACSEFYLPRKTTSAPLYMTRRKMARQCVRKSARWRAPTVSRFVRPPRHFSCKGNDKL
jgi:hypothetical protein